MLYLGRRSIVAREVRGRLPTSSPPNNSIRVVAGVDITVVVAVVVVALKDAVSSHLDALSAVVVAADA